MRPGLGLAGALLAELMLAGCVACRRRPARHHRHSAPDAVLRTRVLERAGRRAAAAPVADWLAFLARTAAADVAGRLERAGYLVAAPAAALAPGPVAARPIRTGRSRR